MWDELLNLENYINNNGVDMNKITKKQIERIEQWNKQLLENGTLKIQNYKFVFKEIYKKYEMFYQIKIYYNNKLHEIVEHYYNNDLFKDLFTKNVFEFQECFKLLD